MEAREAKGTLGKAKARHVAARAYFDTARGADIRPAGLALAKARDGQRDAEREFRLATQNTILFTPQVVAPGERYPIRWTNCFRNFSAIAEVIRLNAKTIRIKLVEQVPDDYRVGQIFPVPRAGVANRRWSYQNCLVSW